MNLTLNDYIEGTRDPNEMDYYRKLKQWFVSEESFLEYYETVEEEGEMPDLYGKSIVANENQFPDVYKILMEIADFLKMEPPQCFIYDSQKCLIDSEGIKIPRLEISSRLVREFSKMELTHVLAKEMYHIKVGHIRTEVMSDKIMNLIEAIPNLPGINIIKNVGGDIPFSAGAFHFRSISFKWFKVACFSADNFATVYTGSFSDSIRALLLGVFNERKLINEIDLKHFIDQIGEIESCTGPNAAFEVVNEVIPYTPYRILNILRFIESDTGIRLLLDRFNSRKELFTE